ncbi:MAG: hypothetical protein ABI655_07790 [Phenylobacterium sp.]
MERDALIADIARCVDGDLDRAERIALFARLAADPQAHEALVEAIPLEQGLQDLARAYDRASPSPRFAATLPKAAGARRPLGVRRPEGGRRLVPAPLWMALAGAAATLALAVVVTPVRDARLASRAVSDAARLVVLDVPFRTAADMVGWNRSIDLAPGEATRLAVSRSQAGDLHLRIVGGGDVDVTLVHARPAAADVQRRIQGGAVHYAALPAPRAGDVLVVRNHGAGHVAVAVAASDPQGVSLDPVRL